MCTRIAYTRFTCVTNQLENFKLKAARSQRVTSYLLDLKILSAVMAILNFPALKKVPLQERKLPLFRLQLYLQQFC